MVTEIFLIYDLGFIFSSLVATAPYSYNRIPWNRLGGGSTKFHWSKGKSNKTGYVSIMELSSVFFAKFNLWPVWLSNFLSLRRGLDSVENLVLSFPQRLVVSLINIETILDWKYSRMPRFANLAAVSDSEPSHPKWVQRFDVSMNGMNLPVIFWVYMFLFGEYKGYLHWGLFCWLYLFKVLILFVMACVYFCDAKCNLCVYFCIYVHICKYIGMQWYSTCILYTHTHCGLNLFKFCEDIIVALFMLL